jgi:hypothetical protein
VSEMMKVIADMEVIKVSVLDRPDILDDIDHLDLSIFFL